MTSLKRMTANVLAVYESSSDADKADGKEWYAKARRVAEKFTAAYGVSLEMSVGIIAALSPINSWGNNVKLAERFIANRGLAGGYLKANLAKAKRLLDGEPIDAVLTSDKIANFAKAILGDNTAVVIDRHAADIADNKRRTEAERKTSHRITPKAYARYAQAYVNASIALGIPASELQAITWVSWRKRYWSIGAYNDKVSLAGDLPFVEE